MIIDSTVQEDQPEQTQAQQEQTQSQSEQTQGQSGQPQDQSGQTIIVEQAESQKNGIGVAGFVLALIAVFFGWIPVLGWVVWLLGTIFSFAGVFKEPKGLAIAGLVISLIGVILLISVFGAVLGSAMLL